MSPAAKIVRRVLSRSLRWLSTSNAIPMRIRDAIKQRHEKAIADQLLATLKIDAKFKRFGDPNKSEPDLIYEIDGKMVGIEVATAYYEENDAKDEWEIATNERPLTAGEIRPRSAGVITNPDKLVCEKIQAELTDKCGKTYAGIDETWLCINQQAPLSDATSVADCLKKLEIPQGHKFARMFLTYTPPIHEGGGYAVVEIR